MAVWMERSTLDADDVEAIIHDSYDDIYRYCFWKTKSSMDAQDITQETFLRFVRNLADYSERGKPKALLYTIARNLCFNWLRQSKTVPFEEIDNSVFDIPSSNALDKLADRITLQQYIDELPPEQREVIFLRYGQELQVNEISSIMGITRFSVMYRIRNALSTLKKKIGKGGSVF